MRRAALASLMVSLLLVAIKAVAYFASGSVAMLASLADSALDLFTSGLNMFAIHESLTPADEEHRFGHGKAEPLAGLAQGAFIAASAIFLTVQAVQRLIAPQPIEHSLAALIVMCVSIFATILLILYERRVMEKTGSVAVSADAMHYAGDLVSNIGVVVAILLVGWFNWLWADPVIALGVVLVLAVSAWSVFRQSLDQLMDRELPDPDRSRIISIVHRHSEVLALHELRTRQAGVNIFIQVHIELDGAMPLAKAHAVSDQVEKDICAAFPHAEVIIHQDPAGLESVVHQ
ncbi:MAG TPA: cation diffusion facilitator family transporter [Rhizomicrobium sp.]|nr:cation diffusion facilitator family transporter [Rhizomicrobium sp.]HWC63687.1 cation diffusion facilitator family transporter [Rhizomicrobium sp.]